MGMMDMLNPINAAKKAVGVAKKAPGMQQMGKAVGKFAPPGLQRFGGMPPGLNPGAGIGPSNPPGNPLARALPQKQPMGMQGGGFMGGQNLPSPQQMNVPPPEYRQAGEAAGNDMSWMDAPGAISPMGPSPEAAAQMGAKARLMQMMSAKRQMMPR